MQMLTSCLLDPQTNFGSGSYTNGLRCYEFAKDYCYLGVILFEEVLVIWIELGRSDD